MKVCIITPETLKNTIWWGDNILDAIASSYPTPEVDLTIFTDANNDGWAASTMIKPLMEDRMDERNFYT